MIFCVLLVIDFVDVIFNFDLLRIFFFRFMFVFLRWMISGNVKLICFVVLIIFFVMILYFIMLLKMLIKIFLMF